MSILDNFWEKAKKTNRTIVLPEASDNRTIDAAQAIVRHNLANIILLGNKDKIAQNIATQKFSFSYDVIDPTDNDQIDDFAHRLYEKRKHKNMSEKEAFELIQKPNYFGAMLVDQGQAYGCITGAIHTTADVLRSALHVIGLKANTKLISSVIIIETERKTLGDNGTLLFADCAVNPNPNAEELAQIAISTADCAKDVLEHPPRIALLSFSSKGSAVHPMSEKVKQAFEIVKQQRPDIEVDGEMQLDTALIPQVALNKAPNSSIAGKANCLIFPDLNSGNIGYKLAERFGNTDAIGPLIQGLKKPMHDLSRGSKAMDIVNLAAITAATNI